MPKDVRAQSREQERWDQYGAGQLRDIEENPSKHIIQESPIGHLTARNELMSLMGPFQSKRILELGCGRGRFSVFLAQQGAQVTGVDLGANLIAASKALANVNQVDCEFQQCSIIDLPFKSDTFNIVLGIAVLHHLSKSDASLALQESSRVLKTNGIAIFHEPVENSKLFNLIQNLFPAGMKGKRDYRPSFLQREAWNSYIRALDQRSMTNQELVSAGNRHFRTVHISPYGFLIRLERLIGYKYRHSLNAVDSFLFKIFPLLTYYSQTVLVDYRK
jgi:2-polyprenyl-3-methyl-5-hydroxy-6-metoxy-1,4-benzoquinol methylase